MPLDIPDQRLLNQGISRPRFETPPEVVNWLVAVQSQDYAGAKWALGLRMQGASESLVDRAINDGAILRTHVMRPTWHFVTPDDIRWLLALTAPRVHALNAHMYRQTELSPTVLKRSHAVLVQALEGGRQLTRNELRDVLDKAHIPAKHNLRMSYIMMHAELEGIVCSGARRGKQFTYALVDERAPNARTLDRDQALAELARRYFSSRGPATVHDFSKWSGLTIADARQGLEAVSSRLVPEVMDGQTYWLSPSTPSIKASAPTAYLLSIYDEYMSSYRDRRAIAAPNLSKELGAMGNDLTAVIVLNGRIVGTWKRIIGKDAVVVNPNLLTPLTQAETRAVVRAAEQYGAFHQLPVMLT